MYLFLVLCYMDSVRTTAMWHNEDRRTDSLLITARQVVCHGLRDGRFLSDAEDLHPEEWAKESHVP